METPKLYHNFANKAFDMLCNNLKTSPSLFDDNTSYPKIPYVYLLNLLHFPKKA